MNSSFTCLPHDPTPNPNLITTLSSLNHLTSISLSSLHSLSSVSLPTTATTNDLSQCPFDHHHRLPPHSLFHHFLTCPSSPSILNPSDLLFSLNYPKTLKLPETDESRFTQTIHDPNVELYFSLDEYVDFGPNFFYRDCPGAVSSLDDDNANRMFTIPGFLSVECLNFSNFKVTEIEGFSRVSVRLLPSEVWGIKSEIEKWIDYPSLYSFGVLRAIIGFDMIERSIDLRKWLLLNSPPYGVVIDGFMSDHIFLLCRLCLKAIVREAKSSWEMMAKEGNPDVNSRDFNVKCPILNQVLLWLASQLSVLYGEWNGKLFSIAMLRHCISSVAFQLLLFPSEQKLTEFPARKEVDEKACASRGDSMLGMSAEVPIEESPKTIKNTGDDLAGAVTHGGDVYVSQVAAAVAALHERSKLEMKIRELRLQQHTTRYQLVAEHDSITKKADEKREMCPNYRPIIEHDGLHFQQSHDQESSKTRTREELLAEERDYKRRRMSYRGKKLKRSSKEVMRDIIEEYTEKIRKAGGIGCFGRGVESEGLISSKPSSLFSGEGANDLKSSLPDSSDSCRRNSQNHLKELNSDNNVKSSRSRDCQTQSSPRQHEHSEYQRQRSDRKDYDRKYSLRSPKRKNHDSDYCSRSVERKDHDRHYYSRSPESKNHDTGCYSRSPERKYRDRDYYSRTLEKKNHDEAYYSGSPELYTSHGHSYEHSSHQREQDDAKTTQTKHYKSSQVFSLESKHRNDRSLSPASESRSNLTKEKDNYQSQVKDRKRWRGSKQYSLESILDTGFEDRYDPSESRGSYDNDDSNRQISHAYRTK
ncbi:hypothetical protein RJ641_023364, partial [Dillenia turbinata]